MPRCGETSRPERDKPASDFENRSVAGASTIAGTVRGEEGEAGAGTNRGEEGEVGAFGDTDTGGPSSEAGLNVALPGARSSAVEAVDGGSPRDPWQAEPLGGTGVSILCKGSGTKGFFCGVDAAVVSALPALASCASLLPPSILASLAAIFALISS